MPTEHTVGAVAAFADAQTGQLDIANARFADATDIRENCEALLKKAGDQLQPKPWYHFGLW